MRETLYLISLLLGSAVLLFLGWGQLPSSEYVTWGLMFGGTTTIAVLMVTLHRVQTELKASRRDLARREAELSFALEVQKALLPQKLPESARLMVTASCVPARGIGGDYYDVLELPDGRILFAIGDVSGKGVSAALLMANLQAGFRMAARSSRTPAEVCFKLNAHLYQVTQSSLFATFFLAEWRHPERQLTYVNAGHHSPILMGSLKGRLLDKGGFPLGLFAEVDYEMGEIELQPSDLLVLYSDGITEAESAAGEEFGESRLAALIESLQENSADEMRKKVFEEVHRWSGGEPEDDMTLMIVSPGSTERMKVSGRSFQDHLRLLIPFWGLVTGVWLCRLMLSLVGAPPWLIRSFSVILAAAVSVLLIAFLIHRRRFGGYSNVVFATFLLMVWVQILTIVRILLLALDWVEPPAEVIRHPHHCLHIVAHLTFGLGFVTLMGSAMGCLLLFLLRLLVPNSGESEE